MVEVTRLERATSCTQNRHSTQLSYASLKILCQYNIKKYLCQDTFLNFSILLIIIGCILYSCALPADTLSQPILFSYSESKFSNTFKSILYLISIPSLKTITFSIILLYFVIVWPHRYVLILNLHLCLFVEYNHCYHTLIE
jgi:hypothetical protein